MVVNNVVKFFRKEILFCDIHPICYEISTQKEIFKRHIQNMQSKESFADSYQEQALPNLVSSSQSGLIKRGKGIDPILQENKAVNIRLAGEKINGIIIKPGQVFSFWKLVGKISEKNGYKDGRVIIGDKIEAGMGGGLCNLANTLHLLILHSPMDVIEFHSHSDALAPDGEKRIPFATGTSIGYNYADYRFKNNTDQDVQILIWCDEDHLYGELRSQVPFPWIYRLVEEDHHFKKEGDKYYRISKIYRETLDKDSQEVLERLLVLDNHSEVMFDYSQIPVEQIRD